MKKWHLKPSGALGALCVLAALACATPIYAEDAPTAVDPAAFDSVKVGLDTVWVLVAGMLVFFMNTGFAMVESGLCRAKNCVNILAKNFVVFAISTISFWVIGWGLMFGGGGESPYLAGSGLWFVNNGVDGDVYSSIAWTSVPLWAKFFFQLVFAGTAATIVSGVVAERIKFGSFIIFSFLLVAVVYPVSGHWIWGGGFLGSGSFRDFAGSTVVHSVGGWAALAGVLLLGARRGKFRDGKVHPIPGHNMSTAALGVFILWLGWFGFNPGSTMGVGDGSAISHVTVNTNMAAATGTLGALLAAWVLLKKPDLSMILNGCLAGLVAITAPCAFTSIVSGAIIGFIAGVLVVLAVVFFDKIKIDDPVGALSVHLVNGVWGTLALGLFYDDGIAGSVAGAATGLSKFDQTIEQLKGIIYVGLFVFIISFIFWFAIKAVLGLRVSAEEETEGLDIGEHGNEAYPDFQGAHNS